MWNIFPTRKKVFLGKVSICNEVADDDSTHNLWLGLRLRSDCGFLKRVHRLTVAPPTGISLIL